MKRIVMMLAVMALLFGGVEPQTASAGVIDYVFLTGGPQFGTMNLTNGEFTPLPGKTGAGRCVYANLARLPGGPLYASTAASAGSLMLILDQSSGEISSTIGSMGNGIEGLKISGSGAFFGYSRTDLYSINPTNANATHIGSFGISTGPNYDAAFAANQMYLEETSGPDGTANLYTVDTHTGAATLVGNTGFPIYGLDFEDGTLYGFTPSGQIISIDTATGAGTVVANENAPGVVFTAATADLPGSIPAVSAPGLAAMAAALLVGGTIVLRRRARLPAP